MFILFYYIIPFIVLVAVHCFYIWFGVIVAGPFSKVSKTIFWVCYASFGIIWIYTDLLWSIEETDVEYSDVDLAKSRYDRYEDYYSNTNTKYKKVAISGVINHQLNVEFAVTLINRKKGCSSRRTISRHVEDRYTNVERIIYPKLKPGLYSIEIYLENYKQDTDCKFELKDEIEVYVFGDNQKHSIHNAKISMQPDNHNDSRIIGNEVATIICKEGSIGRKAVTKCKNNSDDNSAVYMPGITKTMHLNFETIGLISGNDLYNQNGFQNRKEAPPEFLSNAINSAFRKFSIGEIPSFDPR